jgi:hypothetical protein
MDRPYYQKVISLTRSHLCQGGVKLVIAGEENPALS